MLVLVLAMIMAVSGTLIGARPAAVRAQTTAALVLSPAKAAPGAAVKVSGAGFKSGETVVVSATFPLTNGNNATVSTNATADNNGNVNATLQIPNKAKVGKVKVHADGKKSGVTATGQLTVAYEATLAAAPNILPPGGILTVSGAGYPANASIRVAATVTRKNGTTVTISKTVTAGPGGKIHASLLLPKNIKQGTYTATATGPSGNATATAKFAIILKPVVTVSSTSTIPTGVVTLKGTGFTAFAQITVSATFPLYGGGSKTVTATVKTDKNGAFTAKMTVPGHAAAGSVVVTAVGPNTKGQTRLQVRRLQTIVQVSPQVAAPGATITVYGAGYLPNAQINLSIPVHLTNNTTSTLHQTVKTNDKGQFAVHMNIPATVVSGSYTISATGAVSGRSASVHLTIQHLKPSVVVVPTTAAPGASVTIKGFGFAPNVKVSISLSGQTIGTATTNGSGEFSLTAKVPSGLSSGSYTVSATSSAGRKASISIAVNRPISTRYYFASIYTGHQEYLAILNPTSLNARVTITYQLTTGAVHTKTATVKAHSRYTENVNADLGPRVSTAATVASGVQIAVDRIAYRGSALAIVPGTTSPSTIWYFADGNTSHGYVEYIALANPSHSAISAQVHVYPTHHPAFVLNRTLRPTSRTTLKINKYVRDAVGVTVTSSAPIIANRIVRIHRGMTSKIGAHSPMHTWYFAGGPINAGAHNWIGVINPSGRRTYVTLHAYDRSGTQVGLKKQWLKPGARVGYLMNKIAHQTDVSVVLQATNPIVAEQTTYMGRLHNVATDSFGVTSPGKSWAFAAVNTGGGQADTLELFNPSMQSVPIVVQFMTTDGKISSRTYVVGPLGQQIINVNSVLSNNQLGIVVTSDYAIVALNRFTANSGTAGGTSAGIRLKTA